MLKLKKQNRDIRKIFCGVYFTKNFPCLVLKINTGFLLSVLILVFGTVSVNFLFFIGENFFRTEPLHGRGIGRKH